MPTPELPAFDQTAADDGTIGVVSVDPAPVAERLARARAHLIARRVWWFAVGWMATLVAWLFVFVAHGRIGPVGAGIYLLGNVGLLMALSRYVRRGPSLPGIRVGVCGVCIVVGIGVGLLGVVIQVPGDVLAFVLLTLYLTSALLFGWGWRAEGALLVGTMLPLGLMVPRLEFLVAPAELGTALAVGAGLCLAVAEGAARSFRMAFLRRESAEEAAHEVAVSRDAYRDSEERYRSLVETQYEAIVRFDRRGRITFANEYWSRTIGVSPEDMAARDQLEFVHPEDLARVSTRLKNLGLGQPRETRRHRVLTIDGYRWFEWESSAITDRSGRIIEFQAVGRDVHESHLADEALRESEARYRVLVESQQALLSRSDGDGVLTFVNDHLCAAMGRAREELLGGSLLGYVHPDDAPVTRGMIELLSRVPYRAPAREIRVRTHAGWRWFEWEGVGRVDDAGVLVEIQSLGRDVTARRQAQEALQASEARYRGFVESQHDLVFRGDLEGRILFVNDAYCRKFGVRREDLLGENFAPLVYPEDLEHTFDMMRAMQDPPYRATFLNRAIDADGALRWVEWEAGGVADATGVIAEVQGVGRDVTERRDAEEALQGSLKDLRRSQDQLRSLAQRQVVIREQERKRLGLDLHDDVCQELVGIGILLESIRRRLGPLSTENAREFERVGGYLGQLVDHLRLLARELQPLQLRDLGLEGGLRSLVQGFSSASCTVEALFPTAIPRLVEEAEVGVYRIAQEALTNAIRHAEARDVRLMLAVVGDKLRLEVSDDGRGFDTESRTDAFGLVSMEERALSLGGRLTIWSTKGGGGTTVRLECPLGGQKSASAA